MTTKSELNELAYQVVLATSRVALHANFLAESVILDDEIEPILDANITDLRQACQKLISLAETVEIEHHQPRTMEVEANPNIYNMRFRDR